MKKFVQSTTKRLQQRGSALLTSLMVMVGLSLLGLAFVAISETESAISINERNHTQTVSVAEAGARMAVQWFQFPQQMLNLGLMPAWDVDLLTARTPVTAGLYKSAGGLLCDIPYGPDKDDLFFGDEDHADVMITRNNADGIAFLDNLNNQILGPESATQPREGGEITEIRIYAPPLVGATAVSGFFLGGTRYGVATIMARAERFDQSLAAAGTRRSVARAECRIVVSQFPLPTPGGPLQSQTALATNGNFNVNWGLVSSQQTLDLKKDYKTLPWFNAYEQIHINRGYDSSVQFAINTAYNLGDVVRPTPAGYTACVAGFGGPCRYLEFTVTVPGTTGGAEPAWNTTGPITSGGATFMPRALTAWPIAAVGGPIEQTSPWLYYIASGTVNIEDPWFHARSAQNILGSPNNNAQPFTFPYGAPDTYGATHHFQFQSFDQYPQFKNLIFPIINYDFWKSAAIASNGQQGVRYLQWAGGSNYTDGINTKDFELWVNSSPGYSFFETQNNQNPQNGGPGILAPQVNPNGGTQLWTGFIYFNGDFKTTGLAGVDGYFNAPGEPYMDIGYREVETGTGGPIAQGDFKRDASGAPVVTGAVNNQWDYQDLEWSNSGNSSGLGAVNDQFDVYVKQKTVKNPSGGGTYTGYFVEAYYPLCKPGNNSCVTCNCSEPHEPYLNIIYTGQSLGFTPMWQNPAAQTRSPKKTQGAGRRTDPPVVCTAASSPADCTSNAYDESGALVHFTGQDAPTNDGVLYVEGQFSSTGNADYYGSVLVGQGGVNTKGTPQLWYDDSLGRGKWKPPGLPRVLVTSVETDR